MKLAPLTLAIASTILTAPALKVDAQTLGAPQALPEAAAPPTEEAAIPAEKNPDTPAAKVFITPAGKLKESVELLQQQLESIGQPRMNVLFEPGVEEMQAPALDMYSVAGPDALMLIATAAECIAQPIYSPYPDQNEAKRKRIIGYRLERNKHPGDGGFGAMGGGMSPAGGAETLNAYPGMMGGAMGMLGAPGTPGSPAMSGTPRLDTAPATAVMGFGGSLGIAPTTQPPLATSLPAKPPGEKPPEVRVYPLGAISKAVPKERILEGIEIVLQNDEAGRAGAKVKFHDSMNILVVRGSAETHRLVSELLQALEKNAASGKSGTESATTGRPETLPVIPSPSAPSPSPVRN